MEAKKATRILIFLAILSVLAVAAAVFLNMRRNDGEVSREAAQDFIGASSQSYAAANMPLIIPDDLQSGDADGLSVLVYEDYNDAFSAQLAESLLQAKKEFGNRLHFAYRPFDASHSDLSRNNALAVLCAKEQGKGEDFRVRLFAAAESGSVSSIDFTAWIKEYGGSVDDFASCLTNSEKKAKIEELIAQADNFSVFGAPTVFVGDEMIVGARPYESFIDSNGDHIEGLKQLIERQLK